MGDLIDSAASWLRQQPLGNGFPVNPEIPETTKLLKILRRLKRKKDYGWPMDLAVDAYVEFEKSR